MLFSSWQFIILFLPIAVCIYFLLNRQQWVSAGKVWLVIASLFFYSYWDVRYLPLILASIVVNYAIGTGLSLSHQETGEPPKPTWHQSHRKTVLLIGIAANLLLLGYFKYTDFFILNTNVVFGTGFSLQGIVLPLAISFFTFTQIVYLVDSYRGTTSQYDLLNYSLFVTYFPHLIAGPIVQHNQIMPQFNDKANIAPNAHNVLFGLGLFGLGLFKKAVLADTLAIGADRGFEATQALNFYEAWTASLSYTLQLYFDFSGYCDMAIGASLLFNIRLPDNFNSPYKATSIQDFWRRWHMTLSAFLRDYIYIPLGGSKGSLLRTFANLFITFLLGGFWHGATWMFVIWGALHGGATIIHRLWASTGLSLPRPLAWATTFLFVNFAWVFFRAESLDSASRVLKGMGDIRSALPIPMNQVPTADLAWAGTLADNLGLVLPPQLIGQLPFLLLVIAALLLLPARNSMELLSTKSTMRYYWMGVILGIIGLHFSLAKTSTVFLYFNF